MLISSCDTHHWLNETVSWPDFALSGANLRFGELHHWSQYCITLGPQCCVVTHNYRGTYYFWNWPRFQMFIVICVCALCRSLFAAIIVLLHIQGDRKLFKGRLVIPPVERKYKRATLRNAVGEHTCIQEHNEQVFIVWLSELVCLAARNLF